MRLNSNLYHIRPGRDADIEPVIAPWRRLPSTVLRTEDSPAAIERFLIEAQGQSWGAEVDDQVIGAVLVGQEEC